MYTKVKLSLLFCLCMLGASTSLSMLPPHYRIRDVMKQGTLDPHACEGLSWEGDANNEIPNGLSGDNSFNFFDMGLQNMEEFTTRGGDQSGKSFFETEAHFGGNATNEGDRWNEYGSGFHSKWLVKGDFKQGIDSRETSTNGVMKYSAVYWLTEIYGDNAPHVKGTTYVDAATLTQLICLCRVKGENKKCVPARTVYTIKKNALEHFGGYTHLVDAPHKYFFFGEDCAIPPIHLPPNGEDEECVWAILAGKQFKDGRVKNTIKSVGNNYADAVVKCIQNVYAVRTSTLKCFYTGLGIDATVSGFIMIGEGSCVKGNLTYNRLSEEGYTEAEISAICNKIEEDTPSGCTGYAPAVKDLWPSSGPEDWQCVCPANFNQALTTPEIDFLGSNKFYHFNAFPFGHDGSTQDQTIKDNVGSITADTWGCTLDNENSSNEGCLVTEASDSTYAWARDVTGSKCRVCKPGWVLDIHNGNPYCFGASEKKEVAAHIATEFTAKNCTSVAVDIDAQGVVALTDFKCAMCAEGYAYVNERCVFKTKLSDGISACRVELGFTRSTAADEGGCYSCNEGYLLEAGRRVCNKIGNGEDKERLRGCRIGITDWRDDHPDHPRPSAMPASATSRCLLCKNKFFMTGPNGIECTSVLQMGLSHAEDKVYTREVEQAGA
jgi:hypothetical protein